jgi:hypothetical protein
MGAWPPTLRTGCWSSSACTPGARTQSGTASASSDLLVAHQTAQIPQLFAAAQQLIREDRNALFVLLVPATPIGDLVVS